MRKTIQIVLSAIISLLFVVLALDIYNINVNQRKADEAYVVFSKEVTNQLIQRLNDNEIPYEINNNNELIIKKSMALRRQHVVPNN